MKEVEVTGGKIARAIMSVMIASLLGAQVSVSAPIHPQRAGTAAAIDAIEKFILHEMADKEIPAVSIVVVEGDRILWAKGMGWADRDKKIPAHMGTVYRIGSVSKLFTDMAIMQMVERGRIDLDAPVQKYIPEFRPRNGTGKAITLRQLMSHRSGLVREPPAGHYFDPTTPTLARTIASLNRTSLVYPPESRTKYSNAAIATAGYALEKINRQPFAQYLKRSVLEPLGLMHSSFEPTEETKKNLAGAYMWTIDGRVFEAPRFELGMSPAGSMYSTITDLGLFLTALIDKGRGVIKPETFDEMITPQFAPAGQKTGYGIGFRISDFEGRRLIGHGGAIYGFATTLAALIDDRLGVAVVATKDSVNAVTDRIARFALKAMLAVRNNKPIPQPEITAPLDADTSQLEGRYVKGDAVIELVARNGVLMMIDSRAGEVVRVRSLGGALIVDDRLSYGTRIIPKENAIAVDGETFNRVRIDKPAPAPDRWLGLVGEYGWDHNILYIFEKDGKLWALIEWFEFDPLEEVSRDTFKFPNRGLYHGESLVFRRDSRGRATSVLAAGVLFPRRKVGPQEGAAQLRVKPVRPVDALISEALRSAPPREAGDFLPSDLVELTRLDPTIKLDVRYATTNNFLGTIFYREPRAFLQRPAAEALLRAHQKLKEAGYGLMIHDGYRPWYVTKVFWDATPDDKKLFVANPANGSRHNRGAAVDLTLYDLKTGKAVEMVGTYDETTDRAYPDYPGGTSLQRWHRALLRRAMEREGFTVYEAEWWHFDYKDWKKYPIGNVPFDLLGR
jgi:CubicO group peptidase (beta-lactamase class C family)/D-alanyl-D-alanine dipeptidase